MPTIPQSRARPRPRAKPPSAGRPLRAAQYVRMSTEHQRYSTENQRAAIGVYAVHRDIEIVRTYEDWSRSGLTLQGRTALQDLLADVQSGRADYELILVYDVSRWGRFQDADESAHYEFLCRMAGIEVRYCAEMFENDGSFSSMMLKSMKRAMAGEYSRELSVKVFAAHCAHIGRGFWQGGDPGFGLRRLQISGEGKPKGLLERGQLKNLQTDRVVVVPGPPEEVETVQWCSAPSPRRAGGEPRSPRS